MGFLSKLYLPLTLASWSHLTGFQLLQHCSTFSLWQLQPYVLSIYLLNFNPCAMLIFHPDSCALRRILVQRSSLPMNTRHLLLALGSWVCDQLRWSCVGGVLTAHPEMYLYFHKFVGQKCQNWWRSVVGMICHGALAPVTTLLPKTRWLAVQRWEGAGHCHPHEKGSCLVNHRFALWKGGGAWREPALQSEAHWGCSEEEGKLFKPPWRGLQGAVWIQMSWSL